MLHSPALTVKLNSKPRGSKMGGGRPQISELCNPRAAAGTVLAGSRGLSELVNNGDHWG